MAQMFVCKNCGITFRGKASKKPQCCSIACRREAAINARQKTCPQCGKEFLIDSVARDAVHCSRQCAGKAQRIILTCICEYCGKTFEKRPSGQQRHCSHKCGLAAQKGKDRPSMKGRTPWNAKERPPKNVLCELYKVQHLSPVEIGSRFEVQAQTIRGWLHDYGIPVRPDHIAARFQPGMEVAHKKPVPDKETLSYLYLDWKMTTAQIGEHYQASGNTVGKWLKHHGISVRPAGIGLNARGIELPSDAELQHMIHTERLTYREVGERYGVDLTAVTYWLDRAGVARHKTWHERHNNPHDLAAMQALYDDGLSMEQIGQLYGATATPVKTLFQEHNIAARNSGWSGGIRFETKDGNLVRSTYERRVANWLCDQGVEYLYEPVLPFRGLCDFLANGWYIEVWGVDSASYKERKAIKQAQYKAHHVPLIELPFYAFDSQRKGMWERRLARCLIAPD